MIYIKNIKSFFILYFIFFIPFNAYAVCDISHHNLIHMRDAYNEFNDTPNKQTSLVFFNSIPSTFCEFNEIYGWRRDEAGPLYELELYGVLENLNDYIDADKLALKYVLLASEGQGDVDNVGVLQKVYIENLIQNPRHIVTEVMLLSKNKRKNAIIFLFNTFYPSNSILSDNEKNSICNVSMQFCEELSVVEKELLADETHH